MSDHENMFLKSRISAVADQVQLNAHNYGGDDSDAACDLLCAFALICQQNHTEPETVIAESLPDVKAVVANLFPKIQAH